jgi:hypothetical protein
MRFRENEQTDTMKTRAAHQRLALVVPSTPPLPTPTAEHISWASALYQLHKRGFALPTMPFPVPPFSKAEKLAAVQVKALAIQAAIHELNNPAASLPKLEAYELTRGECGAWLVENAGPVAPARNVLGPT